VLAQLLQGCKDHAGTVHSNVTKIDAWFDPVGEVRSAAHLIQQQARTVCST
jgi:hypothetical protein